MEDLRVVRVDRKNKKAKRVVIEIGVFQISFVEENGKIVEVPGTRTRLDGVRICDDQSLWIPPAPYRQARERAATILNEKRS